MNTEIEVILVGDEGDTQDLSAVAEAAGIGKHRVVEVGGAFNYSAKCNRGAEGSSGDMLLFLNDDIEAPEPGWLDAMREHAARLDVGVVGAKLLYPNGQVQHAGMGFLEGDLFPRHLHRFVSPSSHGYAGLMDVVTEVPVTTGACLMIRRTIYDAIGGFDESMQVLFSDVDLCLRAICAGYINIYTPYSRLFHIEGVSRHGSPMQYNRDANLFRKKWAEWLDTHKKLILLSSVHEPSAIGELRSAFGMD